MRSVSAWASSLDRALRFLFSRRRHILRIRSLEGSLGEIWEFGTLPEQMSLLPMPPPPEAATTAAVAVGVCLGAVLMSVGAGDEVVMVDCGRNMLGMIGLVHSLTWVGDL